MSELLTTGQMIDRLKVGESAQSGEGFVVTRLAHGEIVTVAKQDKEAFSQIVLTEPFLKAKWNIYVSFEKAMQALKEGKKVKVIYPKGDHDYIYSKNRNVNFENTTWNEFFEGKWTIEED